MVHVLILYLMSYAWSLSENPPFRSPPSSVYLLCSPFGIHFVLQTHTLQLTLQLIATHIAAQANAKANSYI